MAVIGGGIAGVVMLLLLIFIAFLIFRRPHPQERSLYRKLSLNENPSMDDAQVKLPWVPETCVTRDACDGRSGEFQIQSQAVRYISLHS